jgi:uracil-DNA glycosylase
MKSSDTIVCKNFSCADISSKSFIVPGVDISPERIRMVMISESAPTDRKDYFYTGADALFAQTTLLAFQDAGVKAGSIQELVDEGIYFTTAVKCAKTNYGVQTATIKECSNLLEKELHQFSNVKVFMLMGDVAIKAVNTLARRAGEKAIIPAGSTYKIREQEYFWHYKRVFPSYLQAGPSFFIEKSKRKMIVEDISAAIKLI